MKEKEKERLKKKRNSSESDEEPEYKWVERTKETLELEHHDKGLPKRRNSFCYSLLIAFIEKRKSSHLNENDIKFDTNKRIKLDVTPGSPKKNDILDALLKGASRGYHDNGTLYLLCYFWIEYFYYPNVVKSWDGGVSNLNRIISEEDKKLNSLNNDDDEYNEEFDIGKVFLGRI